VTPGSYWLIAYIAFYCLGPASAVGYLLSRVLAVVVISAAYTLPGIARKVLHGEDISYGVYIYHGLLLNIFLHLRLVAHERYLLWVSGLTYLVAAFSWVCVERPFLRKKTQSIHPGDTPTVSVSRGQTGRSPEAALPSP
jgi:peptidoglycan/LPS O-acetylase OafA/YrhL